MLSENGAVVHTAAGEFEAQQVKTFLEAHGIPASIEGEALRKTHGLTVDGLGAARIVVAEDRAVEARDLLARADAGELDPDTSGGPRENLPGESRGDVLPFPGSDR